MSAPPVTIGLPVYNGSNYIAEAIESLLAQTFTDFRIIISDNASSDDTEDICRAIAARDPRIEYHRHSNNLGAAANYNYTVAQAKSDLFMWHAHDDLRAPKFIELAYAGHDEFPDASVVFSRAKLIGPAGEPGPELPRRDDLLSPLAHKRLRAAITSPHPDLILFGLMRRQLLEEAGGHGSFKGGDRLLVAELAILGRFVELTEILFFNRDHPDRYVRMASSNSDKLAWWDPSKSGRISFPRWVGFRGYLRAVHRHMSSASEKLLGYGAVALSLVDNHGYVAKQLLRDVVRSARDLVIRIAARSRNSR